MNRFPTQGYKFLLSSLLSEGPVLIPES